MLFKRNPNIGVFPCEYCEIFKATYFEKYLRPAAFDCFNGSLLHGADGSRSKLYNGVRLEGLSHRPSFLFQVGIFCPEPSPDLRL